MTSNRTTRIAVAGVAATAVTALLLGLAATATAEEEQPARPDSASGLSLSGLVPIGPLPSVESSDGERVEDALLELGDVRADLGAGVFTVGAERGRAEAAVTQLQLLGLLSADLVRTFCADDTGGVEIVNGRVLGVELPGLAAEEIVIDVGPLVQVSLGNQTRNPDGSLTVTGIQLRVLPAAAEADPDRELTDDERAVLPILGGLGLPLPAVLDTVGDLVGGLTGTLGLDPSDDVLAVTVGETTCNPVDDDKDAPADTPEPAKDEPADEPAPSTPDATAGPAPRPTVVQANLPVTG